MTSPTTAASSSATSTNNKLHHQKMFLGGIETTPADIRERNVSRARCKAAKMLGLLSKYLVLPAPGVAYTDANESPINCYTKILVGYLTSKSALQRIIAGMICAFWADADASILPGPPQLQIRLNATLTEYFYYDEVGFSLTRLLQDARDYLATLKQNRVRIAELEAASTAILTLEQIQTLATTMTDNLKDRFALKPKVVESLEERRRGLLSAVQQTKLDQNNLNIT